MEFCQGSNELKVDLMSDLTSPVFSLLRRCNISAAKDTDCAKYTTNELVPIQIEIMTTISAWHPYR